MLRHENYILLFQGIDVVKIDSAEQSCQSKRQAESDKAIDGKFSALCECSKITSTQNPKWKAKLNGRHSVSTVVIVNRPDCCRKIISSLKDYNCYLLNLHPEFKFKH